MGLLCDRSKFGNSMYLEELIPTYKFDLSLSNTQDWFGVVNSGYWIPSNYFTHISIYRPNGRAKLPAGMREARPETNVLENCRGIPSAGRSPARQIEPVLARSCFAGLKY